MPLLLDLKTHIDAQGSVSVTDLSYRFGISPDAVRGMLQHWIRKGAIEKQIQPLPCGGCTVSTLCSSCSVPSETEYYVPVLAD